MPTNVQFAKDHGFVVKEDVEEVLTRIVNAKAAGQLAELTAAKTDEAAFVNPDLVTFINARSEKRAASAVSF